MGSASGVGRDGRINKACGASKPKLSAPQALKIITRL